MAFIIGDFADDGEVEKVSIALDYSFYVLIELGDGEAGIFWDWREFGDLGIGI